ncbi:MAG: FtsW/RodA/SpoVE family cell cycle protein [Phycisphaerae bacterium]|nr:FtsW/RodA/SpoVE family cell cycle protein [Phycisphaerae bacterium]
MRNNITGKSLILTALAMLGLGVVMVHSAVASVAEPGQWYARVDVRHGAFAIVAALVLATAWRVNYRVFAAGKLLPWPSLILLLIAVGLGLLVFVPGLGHSVGGKFRWIRFGPKQYSIGFQPSELIKIALVIFLASWLTRPGVNVGKFRTFLLAVVVTGGCAGLVVTQDFGTAVLIVLIAGAVMFLAGVPWYYLFSIIPPAVAAGYFFIIETPYRLARITAMLDPWNTTNASAYQSQQSILSILSGGWRGTGLGNGVRKLGFLPEDSTDFIFASFCEEWGFRGAVLLLGLLLFWMVHCRNAASRASDSHGRVLAGALGAMILLQAILHIAVNMVMLPPTGIAMPFLSAGGTGLVLMAGAAAMIVSVTAHPQRGKQELGKT